MSLKNENKVEKQAQKSIYQYFSGFLNSSFLALIFNSEIRDIFWYGIPIKIYQSSH